jgi:hypothetical protein
MRMVGEMCGGRLAGGSGAGPCCGGGAKESYAKDCGVLEEFSAGVRDHFFLKVR